MEQHCRDIGRLLKSSMPPGVGFFLSLFSYGEGGWSTYVSSARRDDMVKFLRELAARIEGA